MEDLILLVEDDIQLGQTLKDFFESNGLSVIWAKDGETAIERFKESDPRLLLLDVLLPHMDGFQVATIIRKLNGIVPIIFMTGTALDRENYHQAYQLLQATNYIEKPVNPHNTLAQIQSLLHPAKIRKFKIKNLLITIDGQLLIIDDKAIQIREKDIMVLSMLLENANSIVTRKDILQKVWNDTDLNQNNALDTSISHLKKNLKNFSFLDINTLYGCGYTLLIGEKK